MYFRSISDLQRDIYRGLHKLPSDVDVVVGIPRSGIMAGSLIALALNLPLAEVAEFASGRVMGKGSTRNLGATRHGARRFRHALVVDDSSRSGEAMARARAALNEVDVEQVTYCVVYGVPDLSESVDIALEAVPIPRIFEWNVFHHPIIETACVDIDGVLCYDPTPDENDDGEAYLQFLSTARVLHKPTRKIGTLVTSRLEKYRTETELWLSSNNIEYGKLVMLDVPDAETRRKIGAHGKFKGFFYKSDKASLFIESERWQALEIANISGKPVLCMDNPEILYPGHVEANEYAKTWDRKGLKRIAFDAVGPDNWQRLRQFFGRASRD